MWKHLVAILGSVLIASVASAAMWASQNGAALYGLAAEAGTYTSCTKTALSTVNDKPALIGMSCAAANTAFGWRFTVPAGETVAAIDIALNAMGNGGDGTTACLAIACGCGGDGTTELELEDVALGDVTTMTITAATTWTASESKATAVTGVDLENGGAYRSCACRAVRLATSGACTDNWSGALEVESVAFKW